MNDRKRSAKNVDTPRPKKTRTEVFDKSTSSKVSLPAVQPLRKLPNKPNALEKYTKASSESTSSDFNSPGKKANRWSELEDKLLVEAVESVLKDDPKLEGSAVWPKIARKSGMERSAKQCRERWMTYLRPDIKKGEWTAEEEAKIHEMYKDFGPRWSSMAKTLPGRTDNDIKNKWNATKRSQERQKARLSPQVSSSSKKAESSLEAHDKCLGSISPNKRAMTPPRTSARTATVLFSEEDGENVAEV